MGDGGMEKRYVVTLNKHAYKTLSLTKKVIKEELGTNYSYSDVILAGMLFLNYEIFVRRNPRVLQVLDQAKNLRLGYGRATMPLFSKEQLDQMFVEWVEEFFDRDIFAKYKEEFLKDVMEDDSE